MLARKRRHEMTKPPPQNQAIVKVLRPSTLNTLWWQRHWSDQILWIARTKMEKSLDALSSLLPRTKIIWSQILSWLKRRNARDINALNKTRVRGNSFVASRLLGQQGYYIRYQNITPSDQSLFRENGVILTEKGNTISLKTLKKSLADVRCVRCRNLQVHKLVPRVIL